MNDTVKLIIEIPKAEYELIVGDEACGLNPLTRAVAHGIPLDGMTNGEVIQALFPQIELVEIYNGRHRFFLKGKESSAFDLKAEVKWLNTPYQKGGEKV